MKIEPLPIDYYIDLLDEREHTSIGRYGDGEWESIFGHKGQNCDGQQYTHQLQVDLINTLINPLYYNYGMVRIATKEYGPQIENFLSTYDIDIDWVDGTVFVDASRAGKLGYFIKALSKREVTYVGPSNLRSVNSLGINVSNFITVPSVNAHEHINKIIAAILGCDDLDVICFSAGPATNVMIHKLFNEIGHKVTMIDIGSLFDWFAGGRTSRKYMNDKRWQRMKRINLNGHK